MKVVTDPVLREILPPGRAAAMVAERGRDAGARRARGLHRTDVIKQLDTRPVRAFRLKTVVGVGERFGFARVSTGVAELGRFRGEVVSLRARDARESGLVYVYSLDSGALCGILEDHYLWALGLAVSSVTTIAACLGEVADPRIGVVGTGRQATLQVLGLAHVLPSSRFVVFHPDPERAREHASMLEREHGLSAQAAESREECWAGDACLVGTSAYEPQTPPEWPGERTRVISVSRASEASAGLLKAASTIVTAATVQPTVIHANNRPESRSWTSRRDDDHPPKAVSMADVLCGGELPRRVVFACLRGFAGGPVWSLLLEAVAEELGFDSRVEHVSSSGRAS